MDLPGAPPAKLLMRLQAAWIRANWIRARGGRIWPKCQIMSPPPPQAHGPTCPPPSLPHFTFLLPCSISHSPCTSLIYLLVTGLAQGLGEMEQSRSNLSASHRAGSRCKGTSARPCAGLPCSKNGRNTPYTAFATLRGQHNVCQRRAPPGFCSHRAKCASNHTQLGP